MATKTKVWISKYALTGGITEHMAEIRNGDAFPGAPFMNFMSFAIGKDAHLTRDGAVVAAEAMRKKKLAAMKKKMAKIEAMTFGQ
jgi:hypothetical protein